MKACNPVHADLVACLHQIQLCSLSDVAGWQAQSLALQQIGIDFFAEAKEASALTHKILLHHTNLHSCVVTCCKLQCCQL